MSDACIDPNTRIGRFLLIDVFRSLGRSQWYLHNVVYDTGMTEPLLSEIITSLAHVDLVRPIFHDGDLAYECKIYSSELRAPLSRSEARRLIDQTCSFAEKLNQADCDFVYENLYLFGSCLTNKANPMDVDLAVDIRYWDEKPIPEPSYYPFARDEVFYTASRRLRPKGDARKIALHDFRELRSIEAPYKRVWNRDLGRVDEELVVPSRSEEKSSSYSEKLVKRQQRQELLNRLAERIEKTTDWPTATVPNLGDVPTIPRSKWLELRSNDLLLTLAHTRCIPAGVLREKLEGEVESYRRRVSKKRWNYANNWADRFIKAGMLYNPWSLRTNGRLLKRSK